MVSVKHGLRWHLEREPAVSVAAEEPLSRHTTFRIGGPARFVVEVGGERALFNTVRLLKGAGIPYRVLGGGSNVLAPDRGLRAAVLKLTGALAAVERRGTCLHAGAGVRLRALAAAARAGSLAGLEFAGTIPGTFGGALAGNAGYGGAQIGDLVASVRVLLPSGETAELSREELTFAYRSSSLHGCGVILGGSLRLPEGEGPAITDAMQRLAAERRASQPLSLPSAGCVFQNPPGDTAGRLIDRAGLRGACEGGAAVSEVHANFIVNRGGATAADVRKLIARAADCVRDRFGIALALELEIMPGDA